MGKVFGVLHHKYKNRKYIPLVDLVLCDDDHGAVAGEAVQGHAGGGRVAQHPQTLLRLQSHHLLRRATVLV